MDTHVLKIICEYAEWPAIPIQCMPPPFGNDEPATRLPQFGTRRARSELVELVRVGNVSEVSWALARLFVATRKKNQRVVMQLRLAACAQKKSSYAWVRIRELWGAPTREEAIRCLRAAPHSSIIERIARRGDISANDICIPWKTSPLRAIIRSADHNKIKALCQSFNIARDDLRPNVGHVLYYMVILDRDSREMVEPMRAITNALMIHRGELSATLDGKGCPYGINAFLMRYDIPYW